MWNRPTYEELLKIATDLKILIKLFIKNRLAATHFNTHKQNSDTELQIIFDLYWSDNIIQISEALRISLQNFNERLSWYGRDVLKIWFNQTNNNDSQETIFNFMNNIMRLIDGGNYRFKYTSPEIKDVGSLDDLPVLNYEGPVDYIPTRVGATRDFSSNKNNKHFYTEDILTMYVNNIKKYLPGKTSINWSSDLHFQNSPQQDSHISFLLINSPSVDDCNDVDTIHRKQVIFADFLKKFHESPFVHQAYDERDARAAIDEYYLKPLAELQLNADADLKIIKEYLSIEIEQNQNIENQIKAFKNSIEHDYILNCRLQNPINPFKITDLTINQSVGRLDLANQDASFEYSNRTFNLVTYLPSNRNNKTVEDFTLFRFDSLVKKIEEAKRTAAGSIIYDWDKEVNILTDKHLKNWTSSLDELEEILNRCFLSIKFFIKVDEPNLSFVSALTVTEDYLERTELILKYNSSYRNDVVKPVFNYKHLECSLKNGHVSPEINLYTQPDDYRLQSHNYLSESNTKKVNLDSDTIILFNRFKKNNGLTENDLRQFNTHKKKQILMNLNDSNDCVKPFNSPSENLINAQSEVNIAFDNLSNEDFNLNYTYNRDNQITTSNNPFNSKISNFTSFQVSGGHMWNEMVVPDWTESSIKNSAQNNEAYKLISKINSVDDVTIWLNERINNLNLLRSTESTLSILRTINTRKLLKIKKNLFTSNDYCATNLAPHCNKNPNIPEIGSLTWLRNRRVNLDYFQREFGDSWAEIVACMRELNYKFKSKTWDENSLPVMKTQLENLSTSLNQIISHNLELCKLWNQKIYVTQREMQIIQNTFLNQVHVRCFRYTIQAIYNQIIDIKLVPFNNYLETTLNLVNDWAINMFLNWKDPKNTHRILEHRRFYLNLKFDNTNSERLCATKRFMTFEDLYFTDSRFHSYAEVWRSVRSDFAVKFNFPRFTTNLDFLVDGQLGDFILDYLLQQKNSQTLWIIEYYNLFMEIFDDVISN